MKRFKPLNILDNKGFWPEKAAVADAIKELLVLGECAKALPVNDFGRYRAPDWRDENNNLVPWRSVDWYIYDALDEQRMQVDSTRILRDFASEPWRDEKLDGDHYDLIMLEEDMYDSGASKEEEQGASYSVGRAESFTAAVISTHRIEHIWGMPYSYIKTEVMRQLCFMFGVPTAGRDDTFTDQTGAVFCTNVCILRPARIAPDDWEQLSTDRMKHGPLCGSCLDDLRAFFSACAQESN